MKFAGVQVGRAPGDVEHEVPKDLPAARCMDHLGVELDAVQASIGVDEPGERRRVGLGRRVKAGRRTQDRIAMAHPDRLLPLEPAEQAILRGDAHAWPVRTRGARPE